jgi:hypothetical protein
VALQATAGNSAVVRLLAGGPPRPAFLLREPETASEATPDPSKEKPSANAFPFGAESPDFLRDYLDERVLAVQVNLMVGTGVVYLTVEEGKDRLVLDLAAFRPDTVDLVPFFPEALSLAQAQAQVKPELIEALTQRSMVPCFFYRGQGGLIWPSLLNQQTLPRTVEVVRRAEAAEREAAKDTAKTFTDILLWYVGARLPLRTTAPKGNAPVQAPKGSAAASAGSALESLTPLQRAVASEAQAILRSKELAQIRAAHAAGKDLEVVINGRTIVYSSELNASGMTLFGENGFVIGREAFKSSTELTKTLLHELHRLTTTASKAEGISGSLASAETKGAQAFGDELFDLGVKLGMW